MSYLDELRASASVVAQETVDAYLLDPPTLQSLFELSPSPGVPFLPFHGDRSFPKVEGFYRAESETRIAQGLDARYGRNRLNHPSSVLAYGTVFAMRHSASSILLRRNCIPHGRFHKFAARIGLSRDARLPSRPRLRSHRRYLRHQQHPVQGH